MKAAWARRTQTGFTIVELLIVIVVIAILATITVVAYTGMQDRASNAAVEADIASAVKKLELVKVDLGRYPQSAAEFPDGFKFSKSAYDWTQNNVYYCLDKDNDKYALGIRAKSLKGYIINTGAISAGVTVNGNATCGAVGKTFTNDATTFSMQGYGSTSQTWAGAWSWTKP